MVFVVPLPILTIIKKYQYIIYSLENKFIFLDWGPEGPIQIAWYPANYALFIFF